MRTIHLNSYGKINLSLDIVGKTENGYHNLEMVLHQIELHDKIAVSFYEGQENKIEIGSNKWYLPKDERNDAYKAAMLMKKKYGENKKGIIRIDIKKIIPIGAGLAGGSSNCAAVLHGINKLWDLNLSLETLCELGGGLGSDIPFAILGQAYRNKALNMSTYPLACSCAFATGTGTKLKPLSSIKAYVIISKPSVSVSTKKVYQGENWTELSVGINHKELLRGLEENDFDKVKNNMKNILELYTLKHYDEVMYTKNTMEKVCEKGTVLMTGSGAAVYTITKDKKEAEKVYMKLKSINKETFFTQTTV